MKHIARWVLILMMGAAAAACSSNSEKGEMENCGANAGRVVDDSVITGKVKAALVADPMTKAHQISVETFKGVVQLSGFVDTSEARSRATQVAKGVGRREDSQERAGAAKQLIGSGRWGRRGRLRRPFSFFYGCTLKSGGAIAGTMPFGFSAGNER